MDLPFLCRFPSGVARKFPSLRGHICLFFRLVAVRMLTYRPAQGGSVVDAVISIISNSGAWFSYARATAFIGERHEGNHIFANYISQWRPGPVAETV